MRGYLSDQVSSEAEVMDSFTLFVGSLAVIGTIGNAFIAVLHARVKSKKIRDKQFFTRVLAWFDLSVCAITMPFTIVFHNRLIGDEILCRLFGVTRHLAIYMAHQILGAVAVHRYILIKKPTTRITARHLTVALSLCGLFNTLLSIPVAFFYTLHPVNPPDSSMNGSADSGGYCLAPDPLQSRSYARMYLVFLALLWIITTLLIVALNAAVSKESWERLRQQRAAKISPLNQEVEATVSNKSPKFEFRVKIGNYLDGNMTLPTCVIDGSGGSSQNEVVQSSSLTVSQRSTNDEEINERRPLNHSQGKTALLLFISTIIYIVSFIPFWVDVLSTKDSMICRNMFLVSNVCNPVLYGITNKKLRQIICGQKNT